MSEQTPTNISNADFTFKDKYGNTGSNKGLSANDGTKLNNMVKLMNLILNTPNSTDFINTLATKQNVGEVTEALTSKADVTLANASNIAQAFKDMSMSWGMPDYSTLITLSWDTAYIADYDCVLYVRPPATATAFITIDGIRFTVNSNQYAIGVFIHIPKGATFKCTGGTGECIIYKIYLKGVTNV